MLFMSALAIQFNNKARVTLNDKKLTNVYMKTYRIQGMSDAI